MAIPDDRSDNAARITENLDNTMHNIELADKMIEETSDPKTKRDLQDKNKRRTAAIPELENELQDELH